MKLCLLAVVMLVWAGLPARARAQSGTDVSSTILVHPDVPTILRLPDEIEGVWSIGARVVMIKGAGSTLYLRPRPDTPAGAEAFIEVETSILHRIFLVRVVERAEDAMQEVTIPALAAAECAEPAIDTPSVTPAPAEPPAGTSSPAPLPTDPAPGPASIEPAAEHAGEPMAERAVAAPGPSRFDLAVHAMMALPGFTALKIRGYAPETALRPHLGLGLRIAATRKNSRWGFEVNVSGEWPAGPMIYGTSNDGQSEVNVGGPWLRAEGGMRVQLERAAKWMPTIYAGLGVQAHLRRSMGSDDLGKPQLITTMENGAVLALGVGLHYRTRDIVLGVDFQARGGGPDDYRSIDVFWTVGYLLDQGE